MQIFLDYKGIDPNFRGQYRVNVKKIMESFVDKKRFEQTQDELKDAKAKTEVAVREKEKHDNEWADKFGKSKKKKKKRKHLFIYLFIY